MPYTNVWTDTDPPGAQAANTIDDELRQLRLDIHERMDDVVVNWLADPVVIDPTATGFKGRDFAYDANAGGNKAGSGVDIKSILGLRVTGTTSSTGLIAINLNDGGFPVGSKYSAAAFIGFQFWARRVSVNDAAFILLISVDVPSNTITFEFGAVDGGVINTETILAHMFLYFSAIPA